MSLISPTLAFRWKEVTGEEEDVSFAYRPGYPEVGNSYFVLQQKWFSSDGEEEWRSIKIDWGA